MKNIFSIVSIILTVAASSISQDSSTIYLWDTDFSILKRDTVTFQSTGEKKQFTEPIDLENIRALTFLQNDSGALIGALCGGVLGFAITTAINNPMLDLLSVPEKEKKAKLIKFLRSK